ncbi:MAG: ferrous iron transporter B [Spirochaetales bacterium]|jgi:ferrous iron transport protein B|nr:ferrous iron transporter B [Spirochaetales bacterium]
MALTIALAGNPNSGKTTLFNALTGSNQFVGNWPGVTVEKKEGRLKGYKDVSLIDLPGIYSLSPYSLEEVIARDYLLEEKPGVILNIIDGTNLERNLFLTTQLLDMGIPVVAAVNMIDVVNKTGDEINLAELGKILGCEAVGVSALKGTGVREAAQAAIRAAGKKQGPSPCRFSCKVGEALDKIGVLLGDRVSGDLRRFSALKVFERDARLMEKIPLPQAEALILEVEKTLEDDSQSIITEERYGFIGEIIPRVLKKKRRGALTLSDKIDKVVTNRFLALPVFAAVIFLIYFVSVTTVGAWVTDWTNDGLFGDGFHITGGAAYGEAARAFAESGAGEEPAPEDFGLWVPGIPALIGGALRAIGTADWLNGLILDGIVAGVGAVLGFVPQMLVLFFFLASLEACGYMARIAFILDRVFRRFGLSGRSFIPMLISTGCGIPGVMASRTIENQMDRRMTIMTTTFMPCGAKLPIIALISGSVLGGVWWVAPSAYFLGIFSVVVSGLILKKTRMFAGDASPFVMELPAYHFPAPGNVLRSMGERAWSFMRKAGSIILVSAALVWFLSGFGFTEDGFGMVEDLREGLLAGIGGAIAWIFAPLGFGTWEAAVATLTGLVAKENVVGTMGVLYGFAEVAEDGQQMWEAFAANFTAISAYAFLAFNLLCAPCFAAIGAIKREMNNAKWTLFALSYQTVYAYCTALIIYQLGSFFAGGVFTAGTIAGFAAPALLVFLLVRKSGGKPKPRDAEA